MKERDRSRVRELARYLRDKDTFLEGRTCGSCRLCCKVVNVDDPGTEDRAPMRKTAGPWCKHAGPGGCAIHSDPSFPKACGAYQCAWLEGMFPDDMKPDQCGLVIHMEPCPAISNGPVWHVHEKEPGWCSKNRSARLMLAALVADSRFPVVVLHGRPRDSVEGIPAKRLQSVTIYANKSKRSGHFSDDFKDRDGQEDWSR